jgi:hypothetical protein
MFIYRYYYQVVMKPKDLVLYGTAATIITAPLSAYADDIMKGARGPTNWQVDSRVGVTEVEATKDLPSIEKVTNHLIVKYWDGERFGKWGFVNLQYRFEDSGKESKRGLGDVYVGAGPRFSTGNFHAMGYLGIKLQKGELTNNRNETSFGILATYEFKPYELDAMLERVVTGLDAKGINQPNEFTAGLLGAAAAGSKFKGGIGASAKTNDQGDYSAEAIAVGRFIHSKYFHMEAVYRHGLNGNNMPKQDSYWVFARANLASKHR